MSVACENEFENRLVGGQFFLETAVVAFFQDQAAFWPDEASQGRKQKSRARQYRPSVALVSQSSFCVYR